MKVLVQKWEESERGWGTRPAGYSLHLSEDDRERYIENYLASEPTDSVPDVYERPNGLPYWCELEDTDLRVTRLLASGRGVSIVSNDYPGHGGVNGWVPRCK